MIEGDLNTLLALFSQLFPEEFANPNFDTCVMSIYYYCYFKILFKRWTLSQSDLLNILLYAVLPWQKTHLRYFHWI